MRVTNCVYESSSAHFVGDRLTFALVDFIETDLPISYFNTCLKSSPKNIRLRRAARLHLICFVVTSCLPYSADDFTRY